MIVIKLIYEMYKHQTVFLYNTLIKNKIIIVHKIKMIQKCLKCLRLSWFNEWALYINNRFNNKYKIKLQTKLKLDIHVNILYFIKYMSNKCQGVELDNLI